MSDRDRILATAARGWEGQICDLVDATDVAAFLLEQTLSRDVVDTVALTKDEVTRIMFVTYQTHTMMKALRDRYYQAVELK